MKFFLFNIFFLHIVFAQITLPTFQGSHKAHSSVCESGFKTFSYTGSQQTFTVPSGVTTITIKVWGAQGGGEPASGLWGAGAQLGGGGGFSYIEGVSSSETIAGNATMPDPDGGTMTGRDGNGVVIITW